MDDFRTSISSDEYGRHGKDIEGYLDSVHSEVSRTFELALRQLEDEDLRKEVRDSYLLCRIADTIEDTDLIPGEKKSELLNSYSGLIESHRSEEGGYREVADWVRDVSDSLKDNHINDLTGEREDIDESYWSLVRNAHTAFSSYERFDKGPRNDVGESIQEMAEGMAEYVKGEEGIRIKDEDDLFDYCHYVAGTVGDFLTDLFARRSEESDEEVLRENSEDYAQLLQRINVARDPVADLKDEDAIFIPETYMEGLSHEEFSQEVDEAVESENVREEHGGLVRSVENVLESAERRADSAVEYVTEFDQEDEKGIRAYLETPLLLALATQDQTEPEDAFTEEGLKIGREEVGKIMQRAGNIPGEELKDREKLLEKTLA